MSQIKALCPQPGPGDQPCRWLDPAPRLALRACGSGMGAPLGQEQPLALVAGLLLSLLAPAGNSAPVTSEDVALLGQESEAIRCFSRSFEDLTCFWEEAEPGNQTYRFYYAYGREPDRECALTTQRLSGRGRRHVCIFPSHAVRLFTQLRLHLRDPASNQSTFSRHVAVDTVGLIAPPVNIKASWTGAAGELRVSWEPPATPYSEFFIYEICYCIVGSTEPPFRKQVDNSRACVLSPLQPGAKYHMRIRTKPDGLSLDGFWGPWSPAVAAETPHSSGEIGLRCFTPDLQWLRCEWAWDPADSRSSHSLFYRPQGSQAASSAHQPPPDPPGQRQRRAAQAAVGPTPGAPGRAPRVSDPLRTGEQPGLEGPADPACSQQRDPGPARWPPLPPAGASQAQWAAAPGLLERLVRAHRGDSSWSSNVKRKLWPPAPDLHRVLATFLAEGSKQQQAIPAFYNKPCEDVIRPCLLEVLSESPPEPPLQKAGSPPGPEDAEAPAGSSLQQDYMVLQPSSPAGSRYENEYLDSREEGADPYLWGLAVLLPHVPGAHSEHQQDRAETQHRPLVPSTLQYAHTPRGGPVGSADEDWTRPRPGKLPTPTTHISNQSYLLMSSWDQQPCL
ncbi:thrombopoietin receptor isoform X3 [Pelodiscus sinensis]|uniref:thrombopoietin receptor isoform X3 n=1 Tax=Pelodiscus sinensis TaxID=13735 RepID=UPI003F6D90A7